MTDPFGTAAHLERQRIAGRRRQLRREFTVVTSWGPKAELCEDRAMVHASITGSKGATYTYGGPAAQPESGAEVTRDPQRIHDLQLDAMEQAR